MRNMLCVGLGGAIGSMARFALGGWVSRFGTGPFPFETICVNLMGSWLIGLLAAYFELSAASEETQLFLTAGILGGFTTFSAFSLQNLQLLRSGQASIFLLNAVLSVGLGIASTAAGYALVRFFLNR